MGALDRLKTAGGKVYKDYRFQNVPGRRAKWVATAPYDEKHFGFGRTKEAAAEHLFKKSPPPIIRESEGV